MTTKRLVLIYLAFWVWGGAVGYWLGLSHGTKTELHLNYSLPPISDRN